MLMKLFAATAAATLLAGAAFAQTQAPTTAPVATPAVTTVAQAAPEPTVAAPAAIPVSSAVLGDPSAKTAGDPGVVSNGPVPDTQENRAKYGGPDSATGKRTQPAGN